MGNADKYITKATRVVTGSRTANRKTCATNTIAVIIARTIFN